MSNKIKPSRWLKNTVLLACLLPSVVSAQLYSVNLGLSAVGKGQNLSSANFNTQQSINSDDHLEAGPRPAFGELASLTVGVSYFNQSSNYFPLPKHEIRNIDYLWQISAIDKYDYDRFIPSLRAPEYENRTIQYLLASSNVIAPIINLLLDDNTNSSDNTRPESNAGSDQTASVNDTVFLNGAASTDAEGDPLTFQWMIIDRPPESTSQLLSTADIDTSFIPDQVGSYTVQLTVNDGQLNSQPDTVRIDVLAENAPPAISSLPITEATFNLEYQYRVEANDDDGDPLNYTLILAPSGMTINETSGLITWLPDILGATNVSVNVSDGNGGTAVQTYTINVFTPNESPQINSVPTLNASLDTNYQYQVIATDADDDVLEYQLTSAPLGMRINSDGLVTWVPSRDVVAAVTIVVDDQRGGTDTQTYTVTSIGEAEQTPNFENLGDQTALLGRVFNLPLQASDSGNGALQFFASPMPLPSNMSLNSTTGEFIFRPSVSQIGDNEITFLVSNGRFLASETITITVPPPSGVTQLRGQVLTENDAPLPDVRLEIDNVSTFSDINGDYLLDNIPVSGDVRLLVDGSTVSSSLGAFATVPEVVNLIEGAENFLDPPIFLIPLDIESADTVDPQQTSLVTSSRFTDGLSLTEPVTLTIPPGRAIDDATGLPFSGDINISQVTDPDLGPRPLPEEFDFSVYIAIQPFGVTYPNPVPISFPNVENFPPGSRMDFFALNHETGQMEKIGEGLVSRDGRTVDSIGGVVRSNSWHGIVPQAPVTLPAKDQNQIEPDAQDTLDSKDCLACSIDQETGNLKEWHTLPSYKSLQQERTLRIEYNSNTASPTPILPLQSVIGNQSPPPVSMSMRISVDGVQLGVEAFTAVDAVPSPIRGQFRPSTSSLQYDASVLESGIYTYQLTTECYFPISRRSDTQSGLVPLVNRSNSEIGAGWSIAGIKRIYKGEARTNIAPDGTASVTEVTALMLNSGTAENLLFLLNENNSNSSVLRYLSPDGDYSELELNRDTQIYTRTLKSGTVETYDASGVITESRDRNNNTTVYQYDGSLRLTEVIDPVGELFELRYQNEKLASITDPLNRITRFEHDANEQLIAIVEPNGDRRTFEYSDGRSLLTAQTDQRGNTKKYFYDSANRVESALMPDGSVTEYEIGEVQSLPDTSNGLGSRDEPLPAPPLSETVTHQALDFNGNLMEAAVDDRNVPVRITDAVGRVTTFERDENSNPTQLTRPNESVIQRSYDNDGNLLTNIEQFNNARETFAYDNFSLATSYTNPNNNTTTYNRDPSNGNTDSRVNQLGHTTIYEYNSRGLVTRAVTPNQLDIRYTYNAEFLVETITETPPAGSLGSTRVTRFSYDAAGQTLQIITPDNITIDFEYDLKGRMVKITDNLNQVIEYTYDGFNNLVETNHFSSDGSLALLAQQAFDSRNRLDQVSSPHVGNENSINKSTLDNNSNIIGLIDPNGNDSSSKYDAEDRLIESTHRLDGVTTYEYDTNDRITRVVAPNGVTTTYTYDVLGRRLTENSPDRGEMSYSYDVNNNVLSMTDGRGITTTFTYDELERVSTKSFPNTISGKIEDVSYIYDNCLFGVGRLCQRTDESGIWDYEYDSFGNVVKQTRTELGVTYTTEYRYDNGDNITQVTYPTGRVVTVGRDGVRRVQSLNTTINSSNTAIVRDIQYRADNQRIEYTFGNGLVDRRAYDLQGRITQQTLGTTDSRGYSYDRNGNILTRITTPQTSLYAYDALDRLVSDQIDGAEAFNYQYDLNHNRQSKEQDVGLAESYAYESDTNRLSGNDAFTTGTLPSAVEDRQYVYNNANRLYQVIDDGGLAAEYTYNDAGLRTRKTVFNNNVFPSTSETTLYHYDSMGYLIAETTATGQAQKEYLWLEGMVPVAQISQDGANDALHYLHTDHLMTPRFATNASRQITWRWEGEVFGNTPDQEIAAEVNLRFPGQYYDEETNHHYNHYRYYSPGIGRYVTSDPIGLGGGMNTYGYVFSNPSKYIDPDGRVPLFLILPVIGGSFGALASGISEAQRCDTNLRSIALAATRGFVGGAIGTSVGLLTRNVALAGAASGLTGNAAEQALSYASTGQDFDAISAINSTVFGVIGGAAGSSYLSTVGELPSLLIQRTFSNFGRNSARLVGQELISGVIQSGADIQQQMLMNSQDVNEGK